ncbi:MAG: PfkB family carbohydrate kinase [Sphingomicrobium sp.]
MIVAGGVYYERCLTPAVEHLFGSGGRAAVALSSFSKVELHTFFPKELEGDVLDNMGAFGVNSTIHASDSVVQFFYNFPLSMPRIAPVPVPKADPARVIGEKVVRFGCIEGEMIVDAEIAIYDPQSGNNPAPFHANGSKAQRLALVLNASELAKLSNSDNSVNMDDMVRRLSDEPEVVIVKAGPRGAHVYEKGVKLGTVPAYKSALVYKIGSGDIFTAMFAHGWATKELDPLTAADEASRYVAEYVEFQVPNMADSPPKKEALELRGDAGTIYLAGSFFSTEHIWLIEEAFTAIRALGVPCFSPLHHVGVGTGKNVAEADIKALQECDVVLALLSDNDPGSLVEIGYAIREDIPVLVLSEIPGPQDLTMIAGLGCPVFIDLATAIYHAAWAALEE